jgi:hypothetical protein
MIAPLKNFQVGAARERRRDPHPDFAWAKLLGIDFVNSDIFFAMEHRGFHPARLWSQTARDQL